MKTSKSSKWAATNVYGIRGETNHRTPEAACAAAQKREGEGWIVIDEAGNQWGRNGNDEAVIVREVSIANTAHDGRQGVTP